MLFGLLLIVNREESSRRHFFSVFALFVTVYWMTCPIYGALERFFAPGVFAAKFATGTDAGGLGFIRFVAPDLVVFGPWFYFCFLSGHALSTQADFNKKYLNRLAEDLVDVRLCAVFFVIVTIAVGAIVARNDVYYGALFSVCAIAIGSLCADLWLRRE
ncbi:MAG TPA: hypothetical protein VK660_09965 [Xanthomonadaceae bacterium]|nr:hypothetical protein [Xanthomonadaceae bacterium]